MRQSFKCRSRLLHVLVPYLSLINPLRTPLDYINLWLLPAGIWFPLWNILPRRHISSGASMTRFPEEFVQRVILAFDSAVDSRHHGLVFLLTRAQFEKGRLFFDVPALNRNVAVSFVLVRSETYADYFNE